MSERDVLAEIAYILRKADSTDTLLWADAEKMAAALVDVGYRRPRTIETVGELDALPAGSIIRDEHGFTCGKSTHNPSDWYVIGDGAPWSEVVLPAVVLWELNG